MNTTAALYDILSTIEDAELRALGELWLTALVLRDLDLTRPMLGAPSA